ncbi:signal transduction histidine kinase [Arthrobacter sp. W4I7]|nr:signal transduction histidine kinase [Arthrobacter sp. W4I7]
MSREIHDTITQGLASSLLLLEAAGRAWPGDTARADLGQATALLRGNLSETRSLVHELATPGLDASAATVTLGFLPDAVTLDVYDDGTGFDPAAAAPPSDAGGYGLRAMRQRVEQLGGVFSVESAPGEGTIVAAQLPAPADAEGPGESP